MSKTKNLKQIISVIAQIILVIAILLLAIASVVVLLNIFVKIAYLAYLATGPDDDIFGPYFGYYLVAMGLIFLGVQYFSSLAILLHSGLYCLKSTPFSKAKCLHCISSGFSLIIILPYVWLYVGMISHTISEEKLLSLHLSDTWGVMLIFVFFSSLILDIVGTILYKREQKRQLKSADSQKTES